MALDSRKREQLTTFLASLPTPISLKLFAALEADRAGGGVGLPHNEILEELRKRLVQQAVDLPPRRPDARRLFFTPFEDFFVAARRGRKRVGLIPRSSLAPIWTLMMTEPAASEAAAAAAALDEALREGRDWTGEARTLFIAAEAGLGRVCEAAAADPAAQARIAEALGGEDAFADLAELRRMLSGVDFLRKLQRTVPSGAASLTEDDLYRIRTLFLDAHAQSPRLAAFVLLALKGRLEKPWRALGVYYHFARSADERLSAAREAAGALPDALFEDLESLARALERDGADADRFDAQAAHMRVTFFADYADGLGAQAAKVGDNVLANRVEACRDVAAEAFERFCELAMGAMRAAAPVRQSGGSSFLKAQRPDFEEPLPAALVDQAREAASLIASAPALAGRLGAAADVAVGIAADAGDKMRAYANDVVTEIRAAEGEERKAARRLLDQVLSAAEPLLDRDELGLIRDRASAAAMAI